MRVILLLTFIFSFALHAAAPTTPYLVYLKPGTILKRISDRQDVQLSKGIYANVLETSPTSRDLFIVYNKAGIAMYETTALGVSEIEKDLNILPNINAETVYPAPDLLKSNDKIAPLDSQFNIHFDSLSIAALNPTINQNISRAVGSRYEFRTLYNSTLPVNFGVGVNYQSIEWNNDLDDATALTIFSFGPQIERVMYAEDDMTISAFFGAEFAPVYKTKTREFTEEYKAMLFDIGAEVNWNTNLGKWSLGAHFRHHDLTLTTTNRADVNPIPEEISLNSIGGMVGYKYEWDL